MTNEDFIESIRLEGEEWRPVVGWESYYMVSTFGRVATIRREYTTSDGRHCATKQKIRKPVIEKFPSSSYFMFTFLKDGHHYKMQVHRMVAMAFIPNPNNYPQIDHIDTNGLNNHVENLRWCTPKMNANNPITRKKILQDRQSKKGTHNLKNAKSVVQLSLQGEYIKTYITIREAKKDGFIKNYIIKVCKGKREEYKGYKWMYLSDYELLINKSKNPNGSERQLSLPF